MFKNLSAKAKDLVVRAVLTAAQTFMATVVAAMATGIDIATVEAAAVAAGAAGLSVLMTGVRNYLDAHAAPQDPAR